MAADLARIHRSAFVNARPWSADEFQHLMAQPGVHVRAVLGCFAMGRLVLDELEILTVACAVEAQRRGLARQVMLSLCEASAVLGARSVFLEVAADNVPALGLYKSLEFEQVGRRSGYYQRRDGTQCDALILRKSLT
ncbi:GNAT family N-acetyltransferase [Planktomarina temperata]|nr:GNAT family N-acetyltransferase [Planktomarina temperata]